MAKGGESEDTRRANARERVARDEGFFGKLFDKNQRERVIDILVRKEQQNHRGRNRGNE